MSRILALIGAAAGTNGVTARCRALLGESPGPRAEAGGHGAWLTARGDGGGVARRGALTVALDGRVFNRDETGGGPGQSDAELVAVLVERHGLAGAMRRLNADAAVAVWDAASRTLSLARDRWGLRPLYHAASGGVVGAASRTRPLLALPGMAVEPDPAYVVRMAGSHYRTFDNDPERSPFAGVDQVPAACAVTLRVAPDGRVTARSVERYWTLTDEGVLPGAEAELAEAYRELLVDAVRRRLRVAPAPAFTLSGGMDSSSVLACAVRASGARQIAYSTVYADPTYDERHDIATILADCVSDWRPVEVDVPDVMAEVARQVALHDEPVATATWLAHRLLAGAAHARGTRSLLGGLGGDELNAGEFEYFPCLFADLLAAGERDAYDAEVAGWARHHDHPVFRKDAAVAARMVGRLADPARPGRVRPDRDRLLRYADAVLPGALDLHDWSPVMDHPFGTCLQNRTWQDLTRETMPCCLRAEDRNLAPLGMERFHPFLDHRLAELMFRVPGRMKVRDGVTKRLLREAMRGVLPESTRARVAKTGWNAPAHVWFSGANRAPLMDLVRSRSFRERGVYDLHAVTRILDEHEEIVASGAPRENHMMFLWQLVNLELWLRDVDALRADLATGRLSPLAAAA